MMARWPSLPPLLPDLSCSPRARWLRPTLHVSHRHSAPLTHHCPRLGCPPGSGLFEQPRYVRHRGEGIAIKLFVVFTIENTLKKPAAQREDIHGLTVCRGLRLLLDNRVKLRLSVFSRKLIWTADLRHHNASESWAYMAVSNEVHAGHARAFQSEGFVVVPDSAPSSADLHRVFRYLRI